MIRYLHLCVLAAGIGLTITGWQLTYTVDTQSIEYNRGRDLYLAGDIPKAAAAFEKSINHYNLAQRRSGLDRWLYPAPLRPFNALARFYRADGFFDMEKPQLALDELIAGLRANPGEQDLSGVTLAEIASLIEEQCDMAIDVELLMKANSGMAESQGKGGGKGKNKKPGGDQKGEAGRDPNDQRKSTQPGMPSSIDDI